MVSVLGNGNNEAAIYLRGGERRLFTIPGVTSLEWNRNLDAISRATVNIADWRSCQSQLALIHPWAHELVIFRDGARVWEGPVRRPTQTRNGVTIAASDVLGHLERRGLRAPRAGTVRVRGEAQALLAAAFSADDPNVLAYVQALGDDSTGINTVIDTKAPSYFAAALQTLVAAGLSYTVLGRAIIVWSDPSIVLGQTNVLNPTRHLVGNVESAREGDQLTVAAWYANDQGESGYAQPTTGVPVDPFYGQVERIESVSGVAGTPALSAAADAFRQMHYPAPNSLSIPSGSTLNCDSPFPIENLVPGVLTPVKMDDLCWPVEQTMQLTGLKVTQDGNGEKVAGTWVPISSDDGS